MSLQFYNTLSKSKEAFTPIDPQHVRLYVCGPTVYDRAHVGNARAVVVFDMLYRHLRYHYNNVTYVRNITDVDDKINARAKERNISIEMLTKETTDYFHADMAELSCLAPDIEPTATGHIAEMVAMIEQLITLGHAYAADGHVLFEVATDPRYGHLSRRSQKEMIAGARVEVAPYKKQPGDFVLWKPSKDDEPGWDSPWGRGRPGWHIECSAMSTRYLGTDFDIHGGGADLQFPHHENEIAQSCCANPGSRFAHYWLHNGFLTVEGEKMSKSLGNFITVDQLLHDQQVNGEVIRYALLATHYRKPLDFNKKSLSDAKKILDYAYQALELSKQANNEVKATPAPDAIEPALIAALDDDLNTPLALTVLYECAKSVHKAETKEHIAQSGQVLLASAQHLGLLKQTPDAWFKGVVNDNAGAEAKISEQAILAKIAARLEAKKARNFALADQIRNELLAEGITLKDNPDGTSDWGRS